MSEWTLEQAVELIDEVMLTMLEDADDDDVVRPVLVIEAMRDACSPGSPLDIPDGLTVAELRARLVAARGELARRS